MAAKLTRILISQPAPSPAERSPFADITDKYKVAFDFIPFIKNEGVTGKEFREQRVDITAHTAIILTSRTMADNFFRVCEQSRIIVPDTFKYFCTTEAIALYLQKYIVYRKRKIFFGNSDFANLMEIIAKHKDEKYILALSDPHKPEMPEALDKAKIKYSKAILSRTVSNDLSDLEIGKYDMLVFYSPAEIASLKTKFPSLDEKALIATFGLGTSKAALETGYTLSVVAPRPETPSMKNALEAFVAKYNAGNFKESDQADAKAFIEEQLKAEAAKAKKMQAKPSSRSAAKKAKPKAAADKSKPETNAIKKPLAKPVKKSSPATAALKEKAGKKV